MRGLRLNYLLADKGHDSDAVLDRAKSQSMEPVIPPKRNRKVQRSYDKDLYKLRQLVENAFLKLKGWRGIAIPYAKNSASFLPPSRSGACSFGPLSRDYSI